MEILKKSKEILKLSVFKTHQPILNGQDQHKVWKIAKMPPMRKIKLLSENRWP